jgi:2-polyprenyl-3-methyl-5-hydroxy-6-metoxy-1,4-benzoquinol methylase
MAQSWREFWSGDHSIYANDTHKNAHNAIILGDMLAHIAPKDKVLDFGCGEAPLALDLKNKCQSLTLCDGAASVLAGLKQKYPQLSVMSPEDLAVSTQKFDKIFMVSVLQYLSIAEFKLVLANFKHHLEPKGAIFLADIIPPYISMLDDVFSLLKMAYKYNFFIAALVSLVKTAFSPYRSLRAKFGLTQFSKQEILIFLYENGLKGEILEHNISPHQHRFTVKVTLL